MMLGELITALAAADPNQVIPHGFDDPHSYRGYYDELAFQPAENITIAQMLEAARGALGATYQGYKGGDYRMDEYTDCWLAEEGSTGETIGPLLIRLMLEPQAAEQPLAPGPRVHGNCPACKHASLLLGTGGYITCNNPDCTETDAATTVLEQYGAEAHPPRHSWRVETRDPLPDEWAPGSHFASRPHAVERYETANSRAPLWKDGTPVERRIVRETTTYTVEKPQPAAAPQPETLAPDRIVAHVPAARNELHCLRCAPLPLGDIWIPVTSENLEDGGICTECGTDVLLAAQAAP